MLNVGILQSGKREAHGRITRRETMELCTGGLRATVTARSSSKQLARQAAILFFGRMLDADPDGVHPQGEVEPYRELIEELRYRVRSLEDANRENRRIIAALTQGIPELEAPASPEPREVDLSATEELPTSSPTKKPRPRPGAGAETPPEPRSWWRRVFGA